MYPSIYCAAVCRLLVSVAQGQVSEGVFETADAVDEVEQGWENLRIGGHICSEVFRTSC